MRRFLLCGMIGLALGALVLVGGYYQDGADGPCASTAPFTRSFNESYVRVRLDDRFVLAGECSVYARDGHLLGAKTYPEPQYWLYAFIALLAPFVVTAAYRRYRPIVSMPSALIGLIDRYFPRTTSREPPGQDRS